jgi:hypothetical protein
MTEKRGTKRLRRVGTVAAAAGLLALYESVPPRRFADHLLQQP